MRKVVSFKLISPPVLGSQALLVTCVPSYRTTVDGARVLRTIKVKKTELISATLEEIAVVIEAAAVEGVGTIKMAPINILNLHSAAIHEMATPARTSIKLTGHMMNLIRDSNPTAAGTLITKDTNELGRRKVVEANEGVTALLPVRCYLLGTKQYYVQCDPVRRSQAWPCLVRFTSCVDSATFLTTKTWHWFLATIKKT